MLGCWLVLSGFCHKHTDCVAVFPSVVVVVSLEKNHRSLLSSGNAPPINVRFFLFGAGLHGTRRKGFSTPRKYLNHGLGAKLKYI